MSNCNYYDLKKARIYDYNKRISKFIGPSSYIQKHNIVKHENLIMFQYKTSRK